MFERNQMAGQSDAQAQMQAEVQVQPQAQAQPQAQVQPQAQAQPQAEPQSQVQPQPQAQTQQHPQIHDRQLHNPSMGQRGPELMRFEDFCFAYEDVPTLRHINLSICTGDSAVLMGDNGCGKSTLLRAMSGLVFPQIGKYFFDGEEVNEKSMGKPAFAKRLHQRVGFIFQDSDAQLFCGSVADEIAFGPRQMGFSDEEVDSRVDDVSHMLGIEALLPRPPYRLSGGEKKKVAIACILSMNPDVYCFDEPLNGLDAKTRTWLVGFFEQLKEAGKTLIIATHDQSLADRVADYFVYMGQDHAYTEKPHVHINY